MTSHQLLQESVGLTLVAGNDRIDRTVIIGAIGKIIPINNVESFDNLGDLKKWFILFKTNASKEKFLKSEHLKVKDQTFAIHKPYRESGTMVSVEYENLPRPYSSIKTFVCRICMKFTSPNDEQNIPISIKIFGIKVPVLLEGRVKQRSCANFVGTLSRSTTTTPIVGSQTFKQTPSSGKPQGKFKLCYRCKQPGHVQKDCIFDHQGVVHRSTPISSAEFPSTISTPTVVGEHDEDDFENPQLAAAQECTIPVLVLPAGDLVRHEEFISCRMNVNVIREQQPGAQQQPSVQHQLDVHQQSSGQQQLKSQQPIVLSQGEINSNEKVPNAISRAPAINLVEAYKMYKEDQNMLKRPLHDENNLTENDSKKQHLHTSLPMKENEEEDGEI
ncbi:unnamed protein product [Rotaria sordida]|uniref:CCHC-type domain-containing protein n=1 Tax=Rotaria sordida TaxID=392033 RepID=A0A815J8E2_9BILA|nr:unnamed protein product [Rotaria sordida]CAF3989464.1 unnamed protein product [Rotaria sordida]